MPQITPKQLHELHVAESEEVLADQLLALGIIVRVTYKRNPKLKVSKKCARCGLKFEVWPQQRTTTIYCPACRILHKRSLTAERVRRMRKQSKPRKVLAHSA